MTAFVTAGAGFLLAVLWFDLMFDVQVLGHRADPVVPGVVVDSIAAYYARVTTAARPMNRLIAAMMLATLAALIAQIASGDDPRWVAWASLALTGIAVCIAGSHTVPSAVRLGAQRDAADEQSRLARSICRDHVVCFALILSVMVLQLGFAT